MNIQQEKHQIREMMTPRATNIRVRQILEAKGIKVNPQILYEWFRVKKRLCQHDEDIVAAYWQAIRERTEKVQKLAAKEKQRAIAAAKRLVAQQS